MHFGVPIYEADLSKKNIRSVTVKQSTKISSKRTIKINVETNFKVWDITKDRLTTYTYFQKRKLYL